MIDRIGLGMWSGLDQTQSPENISLMAIDSTQLLQDRLGKYEAEIIKSELQKNNGNMKKTYESLGISRKSCLLYTSPSPRDQRGSRMPSSA